MQHLSVARWLTIGSAPFLQLQDGRHRQMSAPALTVRCGSCQNIINGNTFLIA